MRRTVRQIIPDQRRRGAMLVVMLALLVLVLAMLMFCVDVAIMQLARTELRVATDSAAKAAAGVLMRTDGDTTAALNEAIRVASLNTVSGKPLTLTSSNVQFGNVAPAADGSWKFLPGQTPYISVRVTGEKLSSSPSGPINLLFAPVLGIKTFTPVESATASSFIPEICLCIDRSGSMSYDLSGNEGQYPEGRSGSDPPDPKDSRWAALESSVNLFLQTVEDSNITPEVALVTWSSDSFSSKVVEFDTPLGTDYSGISKAIADRGKKPMQGRTNLSAGMDAARSVLTAPTTRQSSTKTIILMTDGKWNEGRDPMSAALDCKAAGVIVHIVTLLPEADQIEMANCAVATGGKHFHAESKAELEDIFIELARTLPVSLTE